MHSEKLGEVANEFDRTHSVHRALKVGALNDILPPGNLRPFLIHAVECGMGRCKYGTAEVSHGVKPEREGMDASDLHLVAGAD